METRHSYYSTNHSGKHEADTSTQRETKRATYSVEFSSPYVMGRAFPALGFRNGHPLSLIKFIRGMHAFICLCSSLQREVGETNEHEVVYIDVTNASRKWDCRT